MAHAPKGKKVRPMTSGSIPRHLLRYSIPVILGNLFQVTYNTVDSIIVGRFAGADALAAVGVASPLMSIALFFIVGIGIGSSVLMSEFYGAGKVDRLRRELSTAMIAGAVLSLCLSAIFLLLLNPLLRLCNTPAEIFPDVAGYLQIVASGLIFTLFYNILAYALRSIGDTRTPLACMMIASLANVVLDLLFVGPLGMGVRGAALATVISQALSAALCAVLLWRNAEPLRLTRADLCVEKALLKKTVHYSYASALQQAGVYVGRVLVQSMVNPLGVSAIAAFSAVNRIDDYSMIPQRDISSGIMVMTAQNRGAKQPDRMVKGLKIGLVIEIIYGLIISAAVFIFAEPLMRLFVSAEETEVLHLGTRYLRLMGFFYFMPGITNGLQGYMRGIGKLNLTMYVTYSQMFLRALFTFLFIDAMGIDAVPFACVAGWVLMIVWEGGLMLHWKKKGTMAHIEES